MKLLYIDSYPSGMLMATCTGAEVNRYKYGGKEFETEGGLNQYDFDARMFTPQTCFFRTPDPKAGDYPWLNPYLYCAANPIRYIDPTGNDIFILDSEDQELFINMYKESDRAYITFDKDGKLNMDNLNKCKSDSWLLNMTKLLGNSELKYNFKCDTEFEYCDDENNILSRNMGEIKNEGAEYKDVNFTSSTGVTTGETGFMGKALLPGYGESGTNSLDDQIYIIVNSGLSKIGRLETLGHEMFGHSLMYEITRDRHKSGHDFEGLSDLNTVLTNNIIRARKEIIQNQLRK